MQPIRALEATYTQLGNGNDSTLNRAVYVRLTNGTTGSIYDIKIRTTANNDSTTVGWVLIAPRESLIIKKEPDQFIHGSSSNVYAQPVSPRE